jgi:hypothetical protein
MKEVLQFNYMAPLHDIPDQIDPKMCMNKWGLRENVEETESRNQVAKCTVLFP